MTTKLTGDGRALRAVIWLPGLAVAIGAAVATAHGLYEVALAARVPAGIAWLYPLITDGLALVAYTATARLRGSPARYAWSIVILAAGLSGLAQAAYLAGDAAVAAPPQLRFGIGAWPAIAAAIVAHLLYLLAVEPDPAPAGLDIATDSRSSPPFSSATVQPERSTVQFVKGGSVHSDPAPAVQPAAVEPPAARPAITAAASNSPTERTGDRAGAAPARERARAAATRHAHHHGALPTVTELKAAAEVSRGTAANVLKALREQPIPLHLVTDATDHADQDDDPTIEEYTQP